VTRLITYQTVSLYAHVLRYLYSMLGKGQNSASLRLCYCYREESEDPDAHRYDVSPPGRIFSMVKENTKRPTR